MSPIANPFHHAVSSARSWGGGPDDYIAIHVWFDASKAHMGDFRHRALRHHTQGIFEAEQVFGITIQLSTCARCGVKKAAHWTTNGDDHAFKAKEIPVRWIGEQHVKEDLGTIPTLADWLSRIAPEPWMNRSRPLSKELDRDAVGS